MYFITICTQDRENLFGEIVADKMVLNIAGKMVERWYLELTNKYSNLQCGINIIMPNHFHCIIDQIEHMSYHQFMEFSRIDLVGHLYA